MDRSAREEVNVLRQGVGSASARIRARDNELAPAIPALIAALEVALKQIVMDGRELGDIPDDLVEAVLSVCNRAEAAVVLVLKEIPPSWEGMATSPSTVCRLLFIAGCRAMETHDRQSIAVLREKIRALSHGATGKREIHGLGSQLTALSCWLLPSDSSRFLAWYVTMSQNVDDHEKANRALELCRIGAAALLADMPSVAIEALSEIKMMGTDLATLQDWVMSEATRTREKLLSDVSGRYLGDSPADALDAFFRLEIGLATFLAGPDDAA
jgi:hypothetical protein